MNDYGRPIRLFIVNLLRWGFRLWVEDGALVVAKPSGVEVSPALAEEIQRRARFIVAVLKPPPAGPLQKYYGRLVDRDELADALFFADRAGVALTGTPAGGDYLIEVTR